MKESKSQTTFNKYLRASGMKGFFELKVAKGNTLQFSQIEQHQYESLQSTQKNGLVWKLSDEDSRKKPCDTISIPALPSYLVIRFDDAFYLVNIDIIVKMKESGRVSISNLEAKIHAEKVIHITH